MLGFGTQFAIADLDEGERLADAPVPDTRSKTPPAKATTTLSTPTITTAVTPNTVVTLTTSTTLPAGAVQAEAPKKTSFKDRVKKTTPVANGATNSGGLG
jgi:hypothetical protein